MSLLLELFLTFFKIGMFTFGGGLAMISIIENICVSDKKWIGHEDMMNITVIAESTPGPIAINCATFVGYKKKGIFGAIIATFGVVLPSFIIICLIAILLDDFLHVTIIANAFKGIKIAVGILILDAGIKMLKKLNDGLISYTFVIGATVVMLIVDIFALKITSISIMLMAGVISFGIFYIKNNEKKEG